MAEDKKLQKKLAKFEEEIMNLARTECSTIEAETQSNLESQRASLKAAADAEAAKYFEAELREIDGQFRAAAFSEKDRLGKELFSIREKYMSNVFDLAADRLREFAAGSEYADFLCAKAREAAMQANFAGGTLYLRQEDLSYADALTAILTGCTAVASPEIHLGGLIVVSADGRARLDLSLDIALDEQKQWFFNNSKLDITL